MSRRRFRVWVLALALAGAALTAWLTLRHDAGAIARRRASAALTAADLVRRVGLAGPGLVDGYRVSVVCAALPALDDCPSELLARFRDEAPRPSPNGALAPLKDSDDWDVIGIVAVERDGNEESRVPLRWAWLPALPALGLLLWSERTAERRRRETLVAWSFLGAPLAHLVVFSFGPVLFTFWLALHRWDLLEPDRPFVGLANFSQLAGDPLFWLTLRNTALYVLYVPVTMALALALALYLNRRRGGERLLRAAAFLPYVTSTVAIAMVWQWIFNPDAGLLNRALGAAGLGPFDWLGSPRTALAAIAAVTVWTQIGYQMVVLLAGLQGIPRSYLDAALVDGASPWQRFRYVTLPLLRPVLLFVLVTGVIAGFQVFTLVYIMTEGGPLHSTDVLVYRIYQTAWEFLRFGEASAMAVVLFGLLLALTVIQFRLLGRRIEHA